MPAGSSANAQLNSGSSIVVQYTLPTKNKMEGFYEAIVNVSSTENVSISMAVDGTIIGTSSKTNSGTIALSKYLSKLSETSFELSLLLTNHDSDADITIESMNVTWYGSPQGAVISSGSTVDHKDIIGTGAANGIHTVGDIQGLTAELATKIITVSSTLDNFPMFDATGNLVDSGIAKTDANNRMNKIAAPTLDNIVVMDSSGQAKDGGKKISDLALVAGSGTQTFSVASSTANSHAVNQSQMHALAALQTPKTDFDAHNALSNPHNTTYGDVGAAALVHTHVIHDTTGLQTSLDSKYSKVTTPVTNNFVSFGAGNIVLDSGISSTSQLLVGE